MEASWGGAVSRGKRGRWIWGSGMRGLEAGGCLPKPGWLMVIRSHVIPFLGHKSEEHASEDKEGTLHASLEKRATQGAGVVPQCAH